MKKCPYCNYIPADGNQFKERDIRHHITIKHKINDRKQSVIDELVRQNKEILSKYIKSVLLDFHRSSLEGKGYDFFFRLSTDLDKLNK
jgi:hypothetical protein